MPTTRYERFLLYKSRSASRRERLRRKKYKPSVKAKHPGGRERDTSDCRWQYEKKYPHVVGWFANPFTPWEWEYLPPTKNQRNPIFRVSLVWWPGSIFQKRHVNTIGVLKRRGKHYPPVRQLPFL